MSAPVALLAALGAVAAAVPARAQRSPDANISGAALYANHCAACHGAQGEGDGPVAAALKVGVPNLRNLSLRNNGEFAADAVRAYIDGRNLPAAHGDRLMPVWGNELGYGKPEAEASEKEVMERIAAIVEYVRSLQYR
ncbi:MAG TPA: cytochrome c [Gammaproteobacteria bacterium]|nr:cytochrome c [Gammaproteobacteria bacterium]